MNVLILAAQNSPREAREEDLPVCLAEMDGKPLLELLAEAIIPLNPEKIIFAFMRHDIARWGLDCIVEQLAPGAIIISVENPTAGAACTALLAAPYIDNDEELLIMSANELIRQDLCGVVKSFREQHLDAGVLCFRSVHPRYAYVRISKDGNVSEAAEKRAISSNAIPGLFWFARGGRFVRGVKNVIRKGAHVQGRYFISSTLNECVLENARIRAIPMEKTKYIPLKTDRQQEIFENMRMGDQ